MAVNKIALLASSALMIANASFASDFSGFTPDEFEIACTASNPCYHDESGWHSISPGSSSPSSEFLDDELDKNAKISVAFETTGLVYAIFYPVIFQAASYLIGSVVDWAAYKYDQLSGLRDGGGAAQKKELEEIKDGISKLVEYVENVEEPLTEIIKDLEEDKPSKLMGRISDPLDKLNDKLYGLGTSISALKEHAKNIADNSQKTNEGFVAAIKEIASSEQETRKTLEASLKISQETGETLATTLNLLREVLSEKNTDVGLT